MENMIEVQDRIPWSFGKRLILLKRFNGDLNSNNVIFQRSPFWIWVFNISIKIMNITIGTCVANEINTCLMVDTPKNGLAWGPSLRIWVDIDITNLLWEEKWFILKMYKKGGSFSNTRSYLSFAIIVVYLVTKIVNVKKLEKFVFHQMMMIFNLVHDFVLCVRTYVNHVGNICYYRIG